jgi:hypothetical protein
MPSYWKRRNEGNRKDKKKAREETCACVSPRCKSRTQVVLGPGLRTIVALLGPGLRTIVAHR